MWANQWRRKENLLEKFDSSNLVGGQNNINMQLIYPSTATNEPTIRKQNQIY